MLILAAFAPLIILTYALYLRRVDVSVDCKKESVVLVFLAELGRNLYTTYSIKRLHLFDVGGESNLCAVRRVRVLPYVKQGF